jgi:hypothetical protein
VLRAAGPQAAVIIASLKIGFEFECRFSLQLVTLFHGELLKCVLIGRHEHCGDTFLQKKRSSLFQLGDLFHLKKGNL